MSLDFKLDIPPRFVARSEVRLLALVLLAAIREEILAPPTRDEEGKLCFEGKKGCGFIAKGKFFEKSMRLSLQELLLEPEQKKMRSFTDSLAMIARLAAIDTSLVCWRALVEELCDGVKVQAAAYAVADKRRPPKSWQEFENWTPEGHNLHPCAKTRQGFSAADHLAYAPDFSTGVDLSWLAVDKSLLESCGLIADAFDLGSSWALPVHPWQRQNVLPKIYPKEWQQGLISDLERAPIAASISSSLRTLVPKNNSLPILKTSLGSLMTSTERSMSRHTVLQGPVYSEYLQRIWQKKPPWTKNTFIFDELGGFCWKEEVGEDKGRSRQLSLLFRARPSFDSELEVVPCSMLPQPRAGDLDSRYWKEFFARGDGPLHNFRLYCKLLIPFHLHLMQEYGIALEAHLQNCVVLWSELEPTKLGVRDWGGLRADGITLAKLAPDLYARLDPASLTLTDHVKARRKLIACLYSNHLSEAVFGLCQEFSLEETSLWAMVKEVSREALKPYLDQPLAREVLDKPWPVKSLLRLRLGVSEEDYRLQINPLA